MDRKKGPGKSYRTGLSLMKRSLADREVVYVWADGIYVKAGLERGHARRDV